MKPENEQGRGRGRGRGKGKGRGRGRGDGQHDTPSSARAKRAKEPKEKPEKKVKRAKVAEPQPEKPARKAKGPNDEWDNFKPWGSDYEWDGYYWCQESQQWVWDSVAYWEAEETRKYLAELEKQEPQERLTKKRKTRGENKEGNPTGGSKVKSPDKPKEEEPETRRRKTAPRRKEKEEPETQKAKDEEEYLKVFRDFYEVFHQVPKDQQRDWVQLKISGHKCKTCSFANQYWTRSALGLRCLKEGKDVTTFSCGVPGLSPEFKMAAAFASAALIAAWVAMFAA